MERFTRVYAVGTDGKAYAVFRIPGAPIPTSTAVPESPPPGPRHQLADGRSVNVQADGRMQIAGTQVYLTRC